MAFSRNYHNTIAAAKFLFMPALNRGSIVSRANLLKGQAWRQSSQPNKCPRMER